MKTRFILRDIALSLHLGWPDEERIIAQTVFVTIDIELLNSPLACTTDDLQDTFCYGSLTTMIKTVVKNREFRLLEFLAKEIYDCVKQNLKGAAITLAITKKPPIPDLTGGVTFFYFFPIPSK